MPPKKRKLPARKAAVRQAGAGASPAALEAHDRDEPGAVPSKRQRMNGRGDGEEVCQHTGMAGVNGTTTAAPAANAPRLPAEPVPGEADDAKCLALTKQRARDRLRLCHSCLRLGQQRGALVNMLKALSQGESNSALLLGPPGSGKTAVFEAALQDVQPAQFNLVKLTSILHNTDKVALRELVRQLVACGALEELYASQIDFDDDDEPEAGLDEEGEELQEDGVEDIDCDVGSDGDGAELAQERLSARRKKAKDEQIEAARAAAESSMLSSISTMTSHLLSLLTTQSEQKRSQKQKPIIVVLENMDDFALRPKQALLYVLLDAVQSSSYRPGLFVLATATRLDTVDLLEKRVKSRFSHRVIHCRPSETLECWQEKALHPLLETEEGVDAPGWRAWVGTWNAACRAALESAGVASLLQHEWELENHIGSLYQAWLLVLAGLTPSEPLPTASGVRYVLLGRRDDAQLRTLLALTHTEMALLIAAMHLSVARDRRVFTFEMLRNEVQRGYLKSTRERARDAGLLGAGAQQPQKQQAHRTGLHDRATCFKAFRRLLMLAYLLPEQINTSLSVSVSLRKPWLSSTTLASAGASAAPSGGGGAPALEFVKVRLGVPAPLIVQVAQDRERKEALPESMVRWCLHKAD
ncbi:hypothetical protein K437DRAFT_257386 [Tilletiaria anomala UBC 951]|uniref:Origin recognition complex subunit 4 n=1 Tax=Tilletiaria anomala (strain ATCC 24038 / CBS 436.72 / UBC 951) TaxID=1037660 RepID=A0A066VXV5_TILAU|nr:uncharacterized protein K437DRAFT_257386 [Tilletiaria anomala UBC 951]KDN43654.1 hypothetical protein K437DRAFT_257386 [Tilletiaria anomala UBC 951]